jgi:membrane associated rhomboid family serine protease
MATYLNGNGSGDGPGKDNIVVMPTLAERDRMRKEKERLSPLNIGEPIINMPIVTKWLLGVLIALYILTGFVLPPETADALIEKFGFIPSHFNSSEFTLFALLTPVTYIFLHGSLMHISMNGFMLAAFGSGVEKWLGPKRMLLLFIGSGLFGSAAHYILNTNSGYPMIGASGGLSGLFAAAIIMLNRGQREMGGRFGILPFALLWIGLSIGFGMIGIPGGGMVAWAAHVGGFLGGFAILKLMRV